MKTMIYYAELLTATFYLLLNLSNSDLRLAIHTWLDIVCTTERTSEDVSTSVRGFVSKLCRRRSWGTRFLHHTRAPFIAYPERGFLILTQLMMTSLAEPPLSIYVLPRGASEIMPSVHLGIITKPLVLLVFRHVLFFIFPDNRTFNASATVSDDKGVC